MILSSADILRILGGSEIVRLSARTKIIESRPPLSGKEGLFIYVERFPKVEEFEATWTLWIESDGSEPDDLVLVEIKRLLPGVKVTPGLMTKVTTTDFRSESTQTAPEAPKTQKAQIDQDRYEERFQSLVEDVQDQMLLVTSGRAGKDGRDGQDGRDGRDGRDIDATETDLEDLQNVEEGIAKQKGQVLTWDGSKWTNLYPPESWSVGGGGGGDEPAPLIDLCGDQLYDGGNFNDGTSLEGLDAGTRDGGNFNDGTDQSSIDCLVDGGTFTVDVSCVHIYSGGDFDSGLSVDGTYEGVRDGGDFDTGIATSVDGCVVDGGSFDDKLTCIGIYDGGNFNDGSVTLGFADIIEDGGNFNEGTSLTEMTCIVDAGLFSIDTFDGGDFATGADATGFPGYLDGGDFAKGSVIAGALNIDADGGDFSNIAPDTRTATEQFQDDLEDIAETLDTDTDYALSYDADAGQWGIKQLEDTDLVHTLNASLTALQDSINALQAQVDNISAGIQPGDLVTQLTAPTGADGTPAEYNVLVVDKATGEIKTIDFGDYIVVE